MEDNKLQEEEGLLDDFFQKKREKGKWYHAATICSALVILFILAEFIVDFRRLTIRDAEWQIAFFILILPVLALIFHVAGKKIGWIIGCFYYTGLSLLGTMSVIKELSEIRVMHLPEWKGIAILLLVVSVAIFLLLKPTREYFRINTLILILTIFFAVSLAILLFTTM